MKRLVVLLTLICVSFSVWAREDRSLFISALDALPLREATFQPGGAWVPYPAYRDRGAWDKLTLGYKETLVARGEQLLDFTFTAMPASVYLEYEKTRDRSLLHKYDHPNREALADLILAELAEGKGRFLMKVLDGLYYACERTAWGHGQHTSMQKSKRTLPTDEDHAVSLLSAVYAANVAVGWHFFHEEFDRMDPSISRTILSALEKHSFRPYLERDWSWMGWNRRNGQKVNNWNCYCNYFTLVSFLYADQDAERLGRAVRRCLSSMDQYLDFVSLDGACAEGTFYWTMAGAKMYEAARLLCDASGGALNVLDDPQIRNLGLFMAYSYIGDGWIMDVADCDARLGPDVMYRDVFFRFGIDTGCRILSDAALSLMADPLNREFRPCQMGALQEAREMYRSLESLRYNGRLREAQAEALAAYGGDWAAMKKGLMSGIGSFVFESTQVATLRAAVPGSAGWFLGAKAGGNNVSHGHLDVGSAVLFVDECPVFVDPGVETYSGTTFGKNRLSQWWFGSQWHNVPLIGGLSQASGDNAVARNFRCNPASGYFSCDIAPCYPAEAGVVSWVRSYSLKGEGGGAGRGGVRSSGSVGLTISDRGSLSKRVGADIVDFVVAGDIFLPGESVPAAGRKVRSGEVVVRAYSFDRSRYVDVVMSFPSSMKVAVEDKALSDPRFTSVWGSRLRKLVFTSSCRGLRPSYSFTVRQL